MYDKKNRYFFFRILKVFLTNMRKEEKKKKLDINQRHLFYDSFFFSIRLTHKWRTHQIREQSFVGEEY